MPRIYDGKVRPTAAFWLILSALAAASAQVYTAPAGIRQAIRRAGPSILPGGRIIAPLGQILPTGDGAFGLAISPQGRTVVTANGGEGGNSLTFLDRNRQGVWQARQVPVRGADLLGNGDDDDDNEWKGVFMGLAFRSEHTLFVSEGNSGRISEVDWDSGHRRIIDLNRNGFADSYTGDLAFDQERGILYAVDQANFRVVTIDARTRQIIASLKVGRLPFALALSPDRRKLYVTNIGMFEYQVIPGANQEAACADRLGFSRIRISERRSGLRRATFDRSRPRKGAGPGRSECSRIELGSRGGCQPA